MKKTTQNLFKQKWTVPIEHSAILSTYIMLPSVFKTTILSIFEWPLKDRFTDGKTFPPNSGG